MNFLAHARLSFNDPETLVGNMISDFVKGRKQFDFPPGIRRGITLHRLIDTFTDEHPATTLAKQVFRPSYRLYSGALMDIVYDHFLAIDPIEFPAGTLLPFTQNVYARLEEYSEWLPPSFSILFPYMRDHNWLYGYQQREGIARALQGLVRRSAYLTESDTAFRLFEEHFQLFHQCYRQCWGDMLPFALEQYRRLRDEL